MPAGLLKLGRASISRAPLLFLLTLGGVALGVASVLSIQILNLNAVSAFSGSLEAVSGPSDLIIRSSGDGLDEGLLPALLSTTGVAAVRPLIVVTVPLEEGDGQEEPSTWLELVGADLMVPGSGPAPPVMEGDFAQALAVPGWLAVSRSLAERRSWSVGTPLVVSLGSRLVSLQVGAVVDFAALSPLSGSGLALMDIAQAQTLLGRSGRVDQMDVVAAAGTDLGGLRSRLQAVVGGLGRVQTPESRFQEGGDLLAAFRMNLAALSLVSLLVGLFLVHGSTQASLVRRRREFGVLRSLGASRGQVLGLILGEAALLGMGGVVLGLPLGWAAAAANMETVSRTLTSVYLAQAMERLVVPPWLVVAAAATGVAGAALGALLPALDLYRRPVRELLAAFTLHEGARRVSVRLGVLGLVVPAGAGLWYLLLGAGWRPAGFVLALAILLSLPLLSPSVVRIVSAMAPARRFGVLYAVRTLSMRLQTTAFAVAALAVAVSMLVGITIMVGSFRATLGAWVNQTLQADIYVTSRSFARSGGAATLDAGIVEALAGAQGVRAVDRLRTIRLTIDGLPVQVSGVDMSLPGGAERFLLVEGAAARTRDSVRDGGVLMSEPLARRLSLGRGSHLKLPMAGQASLKVAGVYADYGNEHGALMMDLETFAALFGPGEPSSLALYLEPGRDAEAMVAALKQAFQGLPLSLRSNRTLRTAVMEIFEETFAVTRLLQVMALIIAVAGITLTLLVLAQARVAELALYRALGADRRQIFSIFVGKGLGLAGMGMALGAGGGVLMALVLVFVINRAWFGWTLQLAWPGRELAGEALALLGAAVLAAIYPAAKAGRTRATELSREDAG